MLFYMISAAVIVFLMAMFVVFATIDVVLMRAVPGHWTTRITGRVRNWSVEGFAWMIVFHTIFTLYVLSQ